MPKIKQELLQLLAQRITNPQAKGNNVCLVSQPGCGKTAVIRALAQAMEVPFEIISMGGMEDTSIIKGMSSVWQGSEPGLLLQLLVKMKVSNGIVLLDEIDKLSETTHGKQVQYSLLHLLDYTQNKEFRDNFLRDFHHDLSKVWFICTANNIDKLDAALRDRLYVLQLKPYHHKEQVIITSKYVLPEALENVKMKRDDITITDDGASTLLELLGDEVKKAGIRPVEKEIKSIVSKLNLLRIVTLPDGTVGNIPLAYSIPGFKLPFTLGPEEIKKLYTKDDDDSHKPPFGFYS